MSNRPRLQRRGDHILLLNEAGSAILTGISLLPFFALHAPRTLRTLNALDTGVTLVAFVPFRTARSTRTGRTFRTLRTLRTLWTLRAGIALVAFRTTWPLDDDGLRPIRDLVNLAVKIIGHETPTRLMKVVGVPYEVGSKDAGNEVAFT